LDHQPVGRLVAGLHGRGRGQLDDRLADLIDQHIRIRPLQLGEQPAQQHLQLGVDHLRGLP
jgi:hypothetical protein